MPSLARFRIETFMARHGAFPGEAAPLLPTHRCAARPHELAALLSRVPQVSLQEA
jgi:hypothetical protein